MWKRAIQSCPSNVHLVTWLADACSATALIGSDWMGRSCLLAMQGKSKSVQCRLCTHSNCLHRHLGRTRICSQSRKRCPLSFYPLMWHVQNWCRHFQVVGERRLAARFETLKREEYASTNINKPWTWTASGWCSAISLSEAFSEKLWADKLWHNNRISQGNTGEELVRRETVFALKWRDWGELCAKCLTPVFTVELSDGNTRRAFELFSCYCLAALLLHICCEKGAQPTSNKSRCCAASAVRMLYTPYWIHTFYARVARIAVFALPFSDWLLTQDHSSLPQAPSILLELIKAISNAAPLPHQLLSWIRSTGRISCGSKCSSRTIGLKECWREAL